MSYGALLSAAVVLTVGGFLFTSQPILFSYPIWVTILIASLFDWLDKGGNH